MTRTENCIWKAKCKKIRCSSMSNLAWCDLNSKRDKLKPHYKCPNPKWNCQKLKTFTLNQFMLEVGSIKNKLQKVFEGTQTAWNKFLKTVVSVAVPFIGMAVSAKTKNLKVGQATTNLLKSISEGKILSLTDLHGNGLGLKLM